MYFWPIIQNTLAFGIYPYVVGPFKMWNSGWPSVQTKEKKSSKVKHFKDTETQQEDINGSFQEKCIFIININNSSLMFLGLETR